jgi:VIT1/CCC1 family predicted Fe2+/Mn2+ transporter
MSQWTKKQEKMMIAMQRGEITEYYVYLNIAKKVKNEENRHILERIAHQEKSHYEIWTKIRNAPAKPRRLVVLYYRVLAFIFGYTFTLKLMEKKEGAAEAAYRLLSSIVPEVARIAAEEDVHEKELLALLDEERLHYVGSIVLGLNDALVELTGAIAGFTLAFSDAKMIGLTAVITGIAASISMASSEYLSSKADNHPHPLKSSLYTGVAYIITVIILVLPYLLIQNNVFLSFTIMIVSVILIIFFFNFYISIAKDLPFKKRFLQMVAISLGVSLISFGIGWLVKQVFGLDV